MKFKNLSVVILVIAIHVKIEVHGQDSILTQKKDTLQSPMFYSMAPKFIEINGKLTPNYNVQFDDSDNSNYNYKNEFIGSVNVLLPIFLNKNGWYLYANASYHSYNYKVESNDSSHYENYSMYGYGFRTLKRFDFVGKKWAFGNSINAGVIDAIDFKNISYVASLSTHFKLKDSDRIILGLAVIVDRDIKLPVIPILSYSTWISEPRGIMFSAKLPILDITATKVFNNNTFLKGGINLLNHGHYINSADYSFLVKNDDYKLKRLQVALNTKFERTIYKSLWFGSEFGYAINYRTGISEHTSIIESDQSSSPNGYYVKCGLFLRPATNKWKKK